MFNVQQRSGVRRILVFLLFFSLNFGMQAAPASSVEGIEESVTESIASDVVRWFGFEPFAVNASGTEPITLRVQTNGSPSRLELAMANGETQQLTDLGNGLYTIEVSHDAALFGYASDDVYRNFVGFLDVFDGNTRLVRGNMFVDVYDETIREVSISDPAPDVRVSERIFNIHLPQTEPQDLDVHAVIKRFYEFFPDRFDFINVVSIPSYFGNRFFASVSNSVSGIGRAIQDFSSFYGSQGKLQGYVRFPISGYFDLASRAFSHELGHNWINFIPHPALQRVMPHWPVSTMASGIMGYQDSSNSQGLNFPYTIADRGDGTYLLIPTGNVPVKFTGLDLYLMGLRPPEQSGTYIVFENQQQSLCSYCILEGPVEEFSAQDVIDLLGPRQPAFPWSQSVFRVATLVVSRSRKLSDNEMYLFDYFAERGESFSELPYASGFARGRTYPFFLATDGRGILKTSIVSADNLQINAGMSDAWYNPATDGQGFLIVVFPNSQRMFVAWFTFDTERPPGDVETRLGDPGHRWLTAQGPYTGDSAALTIYLTEGGVFDAADPPAYNDGMGDGTMTIEFADCAEGLISYEITSPGVSGVIPIQRISNDNVALCEALGGQ